MWRNSRVCDNNEFIVINVTNASIIEIDFSNCKYIGSVHKEIKEKSDIQANNEVVDFLILIARIFKKKADKPRIVNFIRSFFT